MDIIDKLQNIQAQIPEGVKLVCVSKFHPAEAIEACYSVGVRDFAESRAQELMQKVPVLPNDIRWHFIGPLQSNKVKYVVPVAYMIHSVESEKLLTEINKCAAKHNKVINVLLEVHIAQEEAKHGFSDEEIKTFFAEHRYNNYPNVRICGLMGIATLTDDSTLTDREFAHIEQLFNTIKSEYHLEGFDELSIGMSDDYPIALNHHATIIRIGSAIFGPRIYT